MMTFAQARKTDAEFISVIDITPLRDGRNPQRVADQLHQASRGLGFIYIKVHGIPAGIIGRRVKPHSRFSERRSKAGRRSPFRQSTAAGWAAV